MAKAAKFFCENCGAEVPKAARLCKKCGRFFSAVRCPACGKTGSPDMFKNGCPSCGYAGKTSPGMAGASSMDEPRRRTARNEISVRGQWKKRPAPRPRRSCESSRHSVDGRLPAWVYTVTVSALLALALAVAMCGINS